MSEGREALAGRTFEAAVSQAPGRLLITGANGFVGSTALRRLEAAGISAVGLVRDPGKAGASGSLLRVSGDLDDRAGLAQVIERIAPAWILHLAAIASPRVANDHPRAAYRTNVGGTLNLLRAAQVVGARVLLASTAQVYGRRNGTLAETDLPQPGNVYARTKLAAERLVLRFAERGGDGLVARPFNHSGPGQSDEYVLPAFAQALVRARDFGARVPVGNLEPERDFLHVDCVLDAYGVLLARAPSGTLANVCRGTATSIGALLKGLAAQLGLDGPALDALVQIDPYRIRADDPAVVVGDPRRMQELGFSPTRSIEQLLEDVAKAARSTPTPRAR